MSATVVLKPGREKSVLNRHPWVFSGAIKRVAGEPRDGDLVTVVGSDERFLAQGYINSQSKITVRLLSWQQDEQIDGAFWREKLARAIAGRERITTTGLGPTTAYRLVNAESDGIPGLIVDRYGDWLVVQFLTLGVDRLRNLFAKLLVELVPDAVGVYERSDVDVREKEGLAASTGLLLGSAQPAELVIQENGLPFWVDLAAGHKTGFYLDQRENRARLQGYADGAEVLNCFSYTGGFSVYAARGGAAKITSVEVSGAALALAQRNMALAGYQRDEDAYLEADVFKQLRTFRDSRRFFDLIILDPPKFAYSRKSLQRATRGYKDINWLAMRLLRPGGILFTFSCSGLVSADLFQKILFGAAVDAGRDLQIVGQLSQGPDHPVLLTFPEGAYLKGVVCRAW